MAATRNLPSVFDALARLAEPRRAYRGIARRAQPDTLAAILLPTARRVYRERRVTAMQPVRLP